MIHRCRACPPSAGRGRLPRPGHVDRRAAACLPPLGSAGDKLLPYEPRGRPVAFWPGR